MDQVGREGKALGGWGARRKRIGEGRGRGVGKRHTSSACLEAPRESLEGDVVMSEGDEAAGERLRKEGVVAVLE